jgi:nicotinate-nucleotide adenylyltransferase
VLFRSADAVLKLSTWHKIERLAELADVVAVTRPGFPLSSIDFGPELPQVHVMEMPQIALSSSDIRARVAAGRPIDYLVPEEVAEYIHKHGLYMEGAA